MNLNNNSLTANTRPVKDAEKVGGGWGEMKLLYDNELVGEIKGCYPLDAAELMKHFYGIDIFETYNGEEIWDYKLFKIIN